MALSRDGRRGIVGECKFRRAPVDVPVLKLLQERAARSRIDCAAYYLFSLGGFTDRLLTIAAADESIRLVRIDEMMAA